jgi:hypothetical protein
MGFTIFWVIVLVILMTGSAYCSCQQNITGLKTWFFATWALGLIPMWAIVSRYSKNIVADAVLYDTTVALVYYLALLAFTGQYSTIRWWQVLGFVMAASGAFIAKIK